MPTLFRLPVGLRLWLLVGISCWVNRTYSNNNMIYCQFCHIPRWVVTSTTYTAVGLGLLLRQYLCVVSVWSMGGLPALFARDIFCRLPQSYQAAPLILFYGHMYPGKKNTVTWLGDIYGSNWLDTVAIYIYIDIHEIIWAWYAADAIMAYNRAPIRQSVLVRLLRGAIILEARHKWTYKISAIDEIQRVGFKHCGPTSSHHWVLF